jgi:hypothetical protein
LPFDQRGHGTGHARRLADSSADEPLGSGLKRGLGRPVASAGSFEASVDPKAGGVLTITVTTSRNGQIVQLETGDGSYDLFPDCSGGTLSFNLESGPVAYDFFFGTFNDIFLVGRDFGETVRGLGKKGLGLPMPPLTCTTLAGVCTLPGACFGTNHGQLSPCTGNDICCVGSPPSPVRPQLSE